jgi:hypothetical protein
VALSAKIANLYYPKKLSDMIDAFKKRLKKLGHWLHSDPHLVLVHYLGDETIYKPMAHGNSKHETRV